MAHATVATASGSPGTTAPAAWPSVMSASGAAKARFARRAQAVGRVGAVLAGEHQLEQRGVARWRSARRRRPGRPGGRRSPRRRRRCAARSSRAEALEAVLRERVEQRLLVGEVAARGGVADADLARELAQRELREAALAQRPLGAREQLGAQVAVVVGALGGGRPCEQDPSG